MNSNIQIDKNYLEEYIPEIVAITSKYEDINTDHYESTTKTPSYEPDIILTMLKASKSLFDKITNETTLLKEISENFEDLDLDLSNLATELNMQVESTPSEIISVENDFNYQNFDIDKYNDNYDRISELYNIPKPAEPPKKPDNDSNYWQGNQYTGNTGESNNSSGGSESIIETDSDNNDNDNNIEDLSNNTSYNEDNNYNRTNIEENDNESNSNANNNENNGDNGTTNNDNNNENSTTNENDNNSVPPKNKNDNLIIDTNSNNNDNQTTNENNNNNTLKTIGIATAGIAGVAGTSYGIYKKSKKENNSPEDEDEDDDEDWLGDE